MNTGAFLNALKGISGEFELNRVVDGFLRAGEAR